MIKFQDLNEGKPYIVFKRLYDEAEHRNQKSLDAVAISSFDKNKDEVDSRFVNLKYIINDKWIFFSNYNSNKARAFDTHSQISALFYWKKINVQVRLKGKISIADKDFSDKHFSERNPEKNALAISSKQSKKIDSFDEVKKNYLEVLEQIKTNEARPEYWGGFVFTPYYFEFWQGSEFRLNKREVYELKSNRWISYLLQP
jgi:pyridoxamine-phosphate oxidase|tara:strand:- start:7374 stop:7973 length:600 start_codon:yes stop_codon:yes gene_type:complete